MTVKGQSLESR